LSFVIWLLLAIAAVHCVSRDISLTGLLQ
jgi:hypothetical protein